MSMTKEVVGKGGTTYVANKVAQYDLGDLATAVNFGKRAPYLSRIVIEATVKINNTSGGSVTIGKSKLYDFLKSCLFSTPEHDFVDLKLSAGQALWVDGFVRKGKFPEVYADTVINNSASGTFNVKLYIDCYDARSTGTSAEDEFIWAEILRDSRFELQWASADAGGTFGAGVAVDSTSAFKVSFVLQPRDEIRLPVLWKLEEQQQTALKDNIPRNGVFFTDMVIEAVHAAGQADTKFAVADFTDFTLNFDGVNVLDKVSPNTLITLFNDMQVLAGADRLPQYEGAAAPMVPLYWLTKTSGKRTKLPLVRGNPTHVINGSLATPSSNLRFVLRYLEPQGANYALKVADRTGILAKLGPNPLKKMKAKTASKVGTTKTIKAMVMPIKFDLKPEAAAA